MAKVNIERRAEIGAAKRARTRAAILEAARICYAEPGGSALTVDLVTQAAGVAKGTFYVHFRDLAELEAALGDLLIAHLSERHESARLAVKDPLTRMATAVVLFLRDLVSAPAQARLVARAIATLPDVAQAVQTRLRGDLSEAQTAGQLAISSVDVATRIVAAIVEQAASLLGAGRLDAAAVPDLARALLRAMGCSPQDAAARTEEALRNADAFARLKQPTP